MMEALLALAGTELLMETLLLWNNTGWFGEGRGEGHSIEDLPNQTTDKSILI